MANVSTTLKREAAIQGWSLWINSVTGEQPNVTRTPDGASITWKPGQASKMEKYFSDAMKTSEPNPDDLNVNVALGPVLLPLAVKKSLGYIAGYTALVAIATKLIWK